MVALKLLDVPLPRGVKRDPLLPVLKKLAPGQIHPLRAHCFPGAQQFTGNKSFPDVRNLPADSITYIYNFEKDKDKAKERHTRSQGLRFNEPFAAGLIKAGACRITMIVRAEYILKMLQCFRLYPAEAWGCGICAPPWR